MRTDHSEYLVVAKSVTFHNSGPSGMRIESLRCNSIDAARQVALFLRPTGTEAIEVAIFNDPPKIGQ